MPDASKKPPTTVLVVEDELLVRIDIGSRLRAEGFVVFEAGHADEAIGILEKHSDIHVVFTDIDMPGSMDGLKLATYVRERWPPVKLIVTSGHSSPKEDGLPNGGRFFPKPYELQHITSAIAELIAAEAES